MYITVHSNVLSTRYDEHYLGYGTLPVLQPSALQTAEGNTCITYHKMKHLH